MKEKIVINHADRHLSRTIWNNVQSPIGIIQIVNSDGGTHHYDAFAKYMNRNGYLVSGAIAENPPAAFDAAISDEMAIMKFLGQKYKLPLFLFGNSYGGLVAQYLLARTNTPAVGGCAACASRPPLLGAAAGCVATWLGRKIWGTNATAHTMNWIMGDKDCRHSHGFYHSLFKNLIQMKLKTDCARPLLIIGSARDISSRSGSLAARLTGGTWPTDTLENVTLIIYPDAGREMLNDMNHREIHQDVLQFFNATAQHATRKPPLFHNQNGRISILNN